MPTRTTSKIATLNGRNVFLVNGEPISYASYCDPMLADSEAVWTRRIQYFVDSGLKMYTLQANQDDVGFDPPDTALEAFERRTIQLDRQAEIIMGLVPDVQFVVRFNDYTWTDFAQTHPTHLQKPSYAGDDFDGWFHMISYDHHGRGMQISIASDAGLEEHCTRFERIIRYVESRPWANRVVCYQMVPHGEGTTMLTLGANFFDCCEEMQKAFRAWVRKNYVDEKALREAWEDDSLTFDTVRVPTDEEWKAERREIWHFIEGNQLRRMRDYMHLQRELYLRWYRQITRRIAAVIAERPVMFGMDIVKQTMLGWQHNLGFYGWGPGADFPNVISVSGAIDVGEFLDEPGLDFLITPADYTARTVGYGWEAEGSADSMRIRGKAEYVENDSRAFNEGQEDYTLGAFKDVPEMQAGLLRNAAWSLTRGAMDYYAIAGGKYFASDIVQEKGIQLVLPLSAKSPKLPHVETEHAIAMIIDDGSPMYENGTSGYQNLAVIWQRVLGLAHSGIPYRVYLFSDLIKDTMPDYRCYLFPNLFMLNEERMQILEKKIFKNGRMAIFGPATGITDGDNLSAEWASRVLGVEMELRRRHSPRRVLMMGGHPIAQKLPASMVYGDGLPYGPILMPGKDAVQKAGGVVLGESTTYFTINRVGLFMKDCGTHKVAWSIAMPIPGDVLRELAREGGCNVWSEEDDVVLASGNIVSVHTVKSGLKKIKLPERADVWDLVSGEKVGEGLHEISVEMVGPETRIFYFGETMP